MVMRLQMETGRSLQTGAGESGGGVLVGVRRLRGGAVGGWKGQTFRVGLKEEVRGRRRARVESHKGRVFGTVMTLAG